MSVYQRPDNNVHRGFFYLDDETVINSLSAVEAGKIDEVVGKIVEAREGGFGGSLGTSGVKIEGSKKSTGSFEEQVVRTRTRFSVFDLWYRKLRDSKAIGEFKGWGPDALEDVRSGDTVEVRADLTVVPIQVIFRLFLWFAGKAKEQGNVFSAKGEALKGIKDGERTIRVLMGDAERSGLVVTAAPSGKSGPPIVMQLSDEWLVGSIGRMGGTYTVIGQVDQVLASGDELPTMRLTNDAPATKLEIDSLSEAIKSFVEPAKAFGLDLSSNDSSIAGPALWLTPIAIYR